MNEVRTMQRQSNHGFSLVELIVVVAIIGILASIVIPNYGKLAYKARSAESKVLLSALYTAEKSFYTEYGAYHTSFSAIGFSPEGGVRFNVGFGTTNPAFEAGPANGYNTPLSLADQGNISTLTNCGDELGVGGHPGNSCRQLLGPNGVAAPALATGLTVSANSYYAGATITVPANYAFLDDQVVPEGANSEIMVAIVSPLLETLVSTPAFAFGKNMAATPQAKQVIIAMNSQKTFVQGHCEDMFPVTTACANGGGMCASVTPAYYVDDLNGSLVIHCGATGAAMPM